MKLDQLQLDDSYVRSLPADPLDHPGNRQVVAACYSHIHPTQVAASHLVACSADTAAL